MCSPTVPRLPELVKALGEKLGIELDGADGAVGIDVDGVPVILQLAGGRDGDILFSHSDLGATPAERMESLLESALQANFLYQGTGGATVAMNPSDGHLHLQRYDWLARLDADRALDALARFADTVAAWRRILADCRQTAPSEPEQPDLEPPSAAPYMRV